MKLFIEEHVDFEPEEVNIEHTFVHGYCDEKTNVLIIHMVIDANLEVGKLYDFDFINEKDEESTLLIYKVLKKMNNNNYLLCEEYYGKIYAIRDKKLLGDGWIICDVKQELGIDLKDYMN